MNVNTHNRSDGIPLSGSDYRLHIHDLFINYLLYYLLVLYHHLLHHSIIIWSLHEVHLLVDHHQDGTLQLLGPQQLEQVGIVPFHLNDQIRPLARDSHQFNKIHIDLTLRTTLHPLHLLNTRLDLIQPRNLPKLKKVLAKRRNDA
jgi:hypothetical protein